MLRGKARASPNAEIVEAELRGLRAEREQIVKWLRHEYRMNDSAVAIADAITRGEHEHAHVEHRPTCADVTCKGCACKIEQPRGYFCSRPNGHGGPCCCWPIEYDD